MDYWFGGRPVIRVSRYTGDFDYWQKNRPLSVLMTGGAQSLDVTAAAAAFVGAQPTFSPAGSSLDITAADAAFSAPQPTLTPGGNALLVTEASGCFEAEMIEFDLGGTLGIASADAAFVAEQPAFIPGIASLAVTAAAPAWAASEIEFSPGNAPFVVAVAPGQWIAENPTFDGGVPFGELALQRNCD